MSQKSGELFLLNGSTPLGAWGHGSGVLTGHAQATASFRRGVKLDAEVDVQGRLEGTVGKDLSATLKAGVDVRAAAVIQAQIPLDLFTEAGLVARADLALAASAFVSLQLSLQLHELEQKVHEALPGASGDLVAIMLDEFELSAGLWAKAAFAAELHAQAVLAGSLLGEHPGVTFSFEASAGLGASAGVSFLLNAGFPDPDNLVRRLAERLATGVEDLLPRSTSAERRVRATSHCVLPGLLGASLTAGRQLLVARTGDTAKALAGGAMVGSVVAHSVDVLFNTALDIALDELHALLADSPIAAAMAGVTDKQAGFTALGHLDAALSQLDQPTGASAAAVFDAVLAVVAAVEELATLQGLPGEYADLVTPPLATIWAIAAVVDGVIVNAASPGSLTTSLLNGAPTADPGPRLQAMYGGELTYRRLTTFLADEVIRLLASDNSASEILALVGGLFGTDHDVVTTLIDLAGTPPAEIAGTVLDHMLHEGGRLLVEDVLPALDAVAGPAGGDGRLLVDDFARPVLTAVSNVVPDVLTELTGPDDRMRAREALSSITLCLIGSGLTTLVDLVLQHASANGAGAAGDLAADVRGSGHDAQAYRQLAAAGQGSAVAPDSVAHTLDHVQTVMPHMGGAKMRELLGGVTGSLTGVGGAGGVAEVASILHTDNVPAGVDVGKVVSQSAGRALAMAGDLFLEMLAEIGQAIVHLVEVVVHALDQAAQTVVHALRDGVALAQKTVDEIGAELVQISRQIDKFLGDVLDAAARLAKGLQAALDHFFDHLLAALDHVLHAVLPGPIADAVYGTLRNILRGLQEVIDMFADIVADVSRALAARLHAAADSGQLSTAMYDGHVNAVVYGAPRHEVHLDIPTFWGKIPVIVDAGSVAGAAVSAATGSAAYAPARQQAVDGVRSYAAQRSAHNQAQAAYNSATTRAGMAQRVDDLQTGQALTVNIDAPLASSVNGAQTRARVRVGGANLSFVQPPTSFGMPNRIRILINDLEVSTPGMDWVQSGNDMTWEVDLVSVVPVVLPLAIPVKRFSRTVPVPQAHRAAGLLPDDAVVSISVSDTPRSHPHNLSPAIAFPAGVPHSRHSLKASPWHPSLAVHPGLNTMAVIVADGSGRTAQSSVVFTMSSPASISGALTIVGVAYDAPEGEHIVIENISNTQVWLEGWTIRDLARHRLGLRPRYLAAGARLRIFTARGADDDTHLYMGRRRSVWNNTGDTAMLFDPEGHLTSSFTYVGGA